MTQGENIVPMSMQQTRSIKHRCCNSIALTLIWYYFDVDGLAGLRLVFPSGQMTKLCHTNVDATVWCFLPDTVNLFICAAINFQILPMGESFAPIRVSFREFATSITG